MVLDLILKIGQNRPLLTSVSQSQPRYNRLKRSRPLCTVARRRKDLGTSPVVFSECLQSPDPPFSVRRTGTSSGALGQDLRCDCAFVCFPCGSPDGPSIAPRTLKAATKDPSLATKRSISGSHSRLYPSLARSPHGDRVTSSEPAPAKLRAKRSLESVKSSKNLRPRTSRKGSRATCPATDQGPYRMRGPRLRRSLECLISPLPC
jgi:hypothetical protein